MNTYLIDTLFEKYTLYSTSLTFKDNSEADANETDESKENFKNLVRKLSENNYFLYMSSGDIDNANSVLHECEKDYKELNPYYQKLREISNLSYYELRATPHLSIIETINEKQNLSTFEKKEFASIYKEELEYLSIGNYRYDFCNEILYNKLSIIFIVFSTILRILKIKQSLEITDQNVNEYYLNNFLVSHGFLFYNNIDYQKKKIFSKHIIEFHNNKGNLKNIKEIVDILVERDSDIYEYYLFYDENNDDFSFLKVKTDETFIKVFNENRSNREVVFEYIVDQDPSWMASKEDLKSKNIKFIKTKYFSINYTTDLSSSLFELSLLSNKLKRYRDLYGEIFKFDIEGFSKDVEMTDYLLYINLLSFRISGYKTEDIAFISANEDLDKFIQIPKSWEHQDTYRKKTTQDIITDSIKEITDVDSRIEDIINLKKGVLVDQTLTPIDKFREMRNYMNNSYSALYRPAIKDSTKSSAYYYLINKYPIMQSLIDEEDTSILNKTFLNAVDNLENILVLYGQSAFKFKDIYSSLYLPKVKEIINFFKSLNSYLVDFDTTLSIEKENKLDILGDSTTATGIIKITNRDYSIGTNSGDSEYNKEEDFINKEFIVDEEVDLMNKLLENDEIIVASDFGVRDHQGINISKVSEYPIPKENKQNLIYTSFSNFLPLINDYTSIFDKSKRLESMIEDNQKLYFNGSIIDFFGQEGNYKEIREKYGLSYFEFKDKVSNILLKYSSIYGSVQNRLGIKKEEYIFTSNDTKTHVPFLKKPFLFRRMPNKVSKSDILFKKMFDRSQYTDAIFVYEFDKIDNKYKENHIYTDKYRSLDRKEFSSSKEHLNKYSGLRSFSSFIDTLKEKNTSNREENAAIGDIKIPDYIN